MYNPWLTLAFQTASLAMEAQGVIALRMMRLAQGGAVGSREAQLMVTEKAAALAEIPFAAAMPLMAASTQAIGGASLKVFRKRVRANRRRLTGRRRRPK